MFHRSSASLGSKFFFLLSASTTAVAFSILHVTSFLLPWRLDMGASACLLAWNYAIDIAFAAIVYLLIVLIAGQLLPSHERKNWITLAVVLWLFFWCGIVYNDLSGKDLIWALSMD